MADQQPAVCRACGAVASDGQPLDWSSSTGPTGAQPLCPHCTRQHLRSIEAKLDEVWW